MKNFVIATIVLVFLSLTSAVKYDISTDEQALLRFADAVAGRIEKVNWLANTSVCTEWYGVTCYQPEGKGFRVHTLHLPNMGLQGKVPPDSLGMLDALQSVSLHGNLLEGPIPLELTAIISVRSIFMHRNKLSGSIPLTLPRNLRQLDLSYNNLTDEIPESMMNLTHLLGLQLQFNALKGTIPMLNLTRLKHLNLSHNMLTGFIPKTLERFPATAFEGNSRLCGPPLSSCSTSPVLPSYRSRIGDMMAGYVFGAMSVLMVLVAIVLTWKLWRRYAEEPFEWHIFGFNLTAEDGMKTMLTPLKGEEVYGSAYEGKLSDGRAIFVKHLRNVSIGRAAFVHAINEMQLIGDHQNLISIRGYLHLKKEGYVILDYISGESLEKLLHGNERSPNWERRLEIAIAAARGLAHIHAKRPALNVHGNIKASKILVPDNGDDQARISRLLQGAGMPVKKARCGGYNAPELKGSGRAASQESDVYSFGIVLLEILTGVHPNQKRIGERYAFDFTGWARSIESSARFSDLFDSKLQMVDSEMALPVLPVLKVAFDCVDANPAGRPYMAQVLSRLEALQPEPVHV